MSKTTGRRGLARTQQTSATLSPGFNAASQKVAVVLAAFETYCDEVFAKGENTEKGCDGAFNDAVDALFALPSPDGAALARKVELFAYPNHIDAFLSDPAARAKIASEGDDDAKKLLILYLDAMALSGVTATVPIEAVALGGKADDGLLDWAGIGKQARDVAANFGGMSAGPKGSPAWEAILNQLIEHASALAMLPPEGRLIGRVLEAATAAEQLGRVLCEDDGGYRHWAVNPQGLCELVEKVTLLQTSARELARETHPGVAGVALQRAFYPEEGAAPPIKSGGEDTATADYKSARRAVSDFGHGFDESRGLGDDPAELADRAGTAMLAAPPRDVAGIAARLGYIIATAWTAEGDLDCPHCQHKRATVSPPTHDELCSCLDGDSEGADALRRALLNLHSQAEAVADGPPGAHVAAHLWNEAKQLTLAAFDVSATSENEDEDFDRLCSAQERWETLTPPSLEALTDIVGYSLAHMGPLGRIYHSADDPRSIRDLLDSGDAGDIIAARVYLHLLRMTDSKSPALLTPPIAGLFPAFDESKVGEGEDLQAAWETHHRLSEPYEGRIAEFASWVIPLRAAEITGEQIDAVWKYSSALHNFATALVGEYEALGGRFNLVRQPDGEVWFGTVFARDGEPRSGEIEYLVARHNPLRRAIADILRKRDGVFGGDFSGGAA